MCPHLDALVFGQKPQTQDTMRSSPQYKDTNGFVTIETGQREHECGKDQFMFQVRSFGVTCLSLPVAAALAFAEPPPHARIQLIQADPMEITTDKPEYCQHLLRRMTELLRIAHAPVPHEVGDLTAEGRRMCDNGQIRSGIMRLRSALMIMEKGKRPAY